MMSMFSSEAAFWMSCKAHTAADTRTSYRQPHTTARPTTSANISPSASTACTLISCFSYRAPSTAHTLPHGAHCPCCAADMQRLAALHVALHASTHLQLVHCCLADVHQLADVVPNAGYVALDGVLHTLGGNHKRLTHNIRHSRQVLACNSSSSIGAHTTVLLVRGMHALLCAQPPQAPSHAGSNPACARA